MKKTVSLILSLLLLTTIILHWNLYAVGEEATFAEREFVIKSNVKFTASARAWNFTEEDKEISLYMNTSWQTVTVINSSHSFESVKVDEDGNKIALLDLPPIEQGQSTEYTVFYQVVSKPRNLPDIDENAALNLTDIPSNLTATYLGNSELWMTNNATLRELAETLKGNETNVLMIIENFVDWIWGGNIDYASHETPLYPNETLTSQKGDCDDQAILLISLCRIVGIPAYLQIGNIYMPQVDNETSTGWNGHVETIQNRIGWHGWAMIYVPPWGWLPVDLTYSSRSNPLAAIGTAAVTSQDVTQYMNIVQTDYVSEAREYRSFLINNGFYIRVYDEIIPGRGTDPFGFLSDWLDDLTKFALVALLIAGLVAGSVVGLFYVRRMKKGKPVNPANLNGGNSRASCGRRFS